jgi:hypothetical protein
MKKGKPYVKQVELPDGIKFKTIQCVDNKDKAYYAYLFTDDNELYVLTEYDYKLVKLDVEDINPEKYEVRIYGDFFNYNITTIGENFTRSQILNRAYKKVDEYSENRSTREENKEGKIARFIFPAQLSMAHKNSNYVNFFIEYSKGFYWLLLSFLLIVLQFVIVRKRQEKITKHIIDFCIIAVTGIFGFLAVNIFPNKFLK